MAEERPLVHLFLIQMNMAYDALQAVSEFFQKKENEIVREKEVRAAIKCRRSEEWSKKM